MKIFFEAQKVFAAFAQDKCASLVVKRGLVGYQTAVSPVGTWFASLLKADETESLRKQLEASMQHAFVSYKYRGHDVTFHLFNNSTFDFGHAEEPLTLCVKTEIPEIGGLLLRYQFDTDPPGEPRGKREIDVIRGNWLTDLIFSEPMIRAIDTMASKKIPLRLKRNFLRHGFSLYCNNEWWAEKFIESKNIKSTIPRIPELQTMTLGYGDIDAAEPMQCFQFETQGILKRLALYEDVANLAESGLDILIAARNC